MENIFRKLEEWGCDTEGALKRFLNDKELYITCLRTVVTDSNFAKLGMALRTHEAEQAFDYAHTLKGVFANLGLIPMLVITETIVEPLRGGAFVVLEEPYGKLLNANEQLKDILGM